MLTLGSKSKLSQKFKDPDPNLCILIHNTDLKFKLNKFSPYTKQMKNSKVEKVSFRQTQQEPTVSKNTVRSPAVCTFCYVLRMACLQMSPANKMIEV